MRHHYVPACYLQSFVDPACPPEYEPYLWVVDLDKGKIRRQSPENTAALTDYYAVGDGENRYDVEKGQRYRRVGRPGAHLAIVGNAS